MLIIIIKIWSDWLRFHSFSTFGEYAEYEVSSKTNATDLLKTKRYKLESYFLQHKVSLIFRWFIQIIVLTPKHQRKVVVSRHSPLLLLTAPGQSYVNKMWTVLYRNLISSVKHSWISCRYKKITVLTINAEKSGGEPPFAATFAPH